ncbi:MAG: DUF92 domain-containing protein [bacterium]|nr:MAG: DUF92 domain-containing protein [bacterium]
MMMDWIWSGILLLALAFVIGCSELIRKKLNLSIKVTRKFVHILTGILIAITPFLLQQPYPLLIISGVFIIVNLIAIKMGWMPGMHATKQTSYGTVFYPISFFILILLLWKNHRAILVMSMLIMAIADAMAAIIGENLNKPKRYQFAGEQKSVQGSAVMLITSFFITVLGLEFFSAFENISNKFTPGLWIAAIVAIIATACESISYKGSDNLTVPLGTAFTLHYMITHSAAQSLIFTIGVGIALFVAVISYYFRFLSTSGAVSTFLLGAVVFGTGKWEFSLPILLFFILSSLLSKMGRQWKQKFADTFQKGGDRDLGQVLANGGIAGFMVLLWNYFPDDVWYFAFIGSVAAVTADTWATEIGVFSKIAPRDILTFKQVPPGTSGGVTLLGLAGGLLGSYLIVLIGSFVTTRYDNVAPAMVLFAFIVGAGLVGSIVDSIMGATIQAQYRCPICRKITEKSEHCQGNPTRLVSGYRLIDNDIVNGICALTGALISWTGYRLLV